MVLADHCIFGFYGFWLPNDPRGSGSNYEANLELLRYGRATKVSARRSVASRKHDQALQLAAKGALKYPPVRITGTQAVVIANGFATAARQGRYAIHACAIMPDHVHMVIGRHERPIRQIVGHVKASTTKRLKQRSAWPADERPVWGAHGWNVFLNDVATVGLAIRYVEGNPLKQAMKRQTWSFVSKFMTGAAKLQCRQSVGRSSEVPFPPVRFPLKSGH